MMLDIKERYHLCLAILAEASCYCMKSSIRLPVVLSVVFGNKTLKFSVSFGPHSVLAIRLSLLRQISAKGLSA